VTEPPLPDKVLALHQALETARIRHAFGGALALAYYAEPRTTIDIDLNLFLAPDRWRAAAAALEPLDLDTRTDQAKLEDEGSVRWWWGRTPVDLFFAYDAIHEAMREAARSYPFGEARIPVLAPEHLVMCKAVFDRPKDWLDIEGVLAATDGFDPDEVRRWLDRIVGREDPRREHFDQVSESVLGE
jgi:hypothetical protein